MPSPPRARPAAQAAYKVVKRENRWWVVRVRTANWYA
jgi:hypothetical protein